VFDASSDPGVLNRAEWIKFMSVFFNAEDKAGGSLKTGTRLTLNRHTECARMYELTLKVSHAPISVERLFSMTFRRLYAARLYEHSP
jgi:hypothetical protein